jgi:hypothetical protein
LSAHASLFGHYDFNRVPLAPPGTKIVGHVASKGRTTFGEDGKVGWYIGPSPEHYRCYKCYFPDTMTERDVLTVDFFQEKIPFPIFTTADYLKQTAEDMLHLLQAPCTTSTTPTLAFGSPILNSYEKIAEILRRAVPPAPAPVAPTLVSPSPVSAQRVPTHPAHASAVSVAPQRVPIPSLSIQKAPPAKPPSFSASSPIAKYREISPRFSHRSTPRQQLAQALQHDPTIAGKMYNPVTGRAENIDSLLRGPDTVTWTTSLTNEWARCAQGIIGNRPSAAHIIGNQTIFFIFPSQVPAGRKVTYATFVCTMRPPG